MNKRSGKFLAGIICLLVAALLAGIFVYSPHKHDWSRLENLVDSSRVEIIKSKGDVTSSQEFLVTPLDGKVIENLSAYSSKDIILKPLEDLDKETLNKLPRSVTYVPNSLPDPDNVKDGLLSRLRSFAPAEINSHFDSGARFIMSTNSSYVERRFALLVQIRQYEDIILMIVSRDGDYI